MDYWKMPSSPALVLTVIAALFGCRRLASRLAVTHATTHASRHNLSHTPTSGDSTQAPAAPSSITAEGRHSAGELESWVRLTVAIDTVEGLTELRRAWGLAVLVEDQDDTVLFDTGPDGPALLHNLEHLRVDLSRVDALVLSHIHYDHVDGTQALLRAGARSKVFVLPSFPTSFRQTVRSLADEVEATPGGRVGSGILTTGELPGLAGEQALIIKTESGLVLVAGCSHPGIVALVERARQLAGPQVRLVLGGFHLPNASEHELDRVVRDFRKLGVRQVAPCHCTGARAISRFRAEYGADCLDVRLREPLLITTADAGCPRGTSRLGARSGLEVGGAGGSPKDGGCAGTWKSAAHRRRPRAGHRAPLLPQARWGSGHRERREQPASTGCADQDPRRLQPDTGRASLLGPYARRRRNRRDRNGRSRTPAEQQRKGA